MTRRVAVRVEVREEQRRLLEIDRWIEIDRETRGLAPCTT